MAQILVQEPIVTSVLIDMKPHNLILVLSFWAFLGSLGWQANAQSKHQQKIDSLLVVLVSVPDDISKIKIYGDLSSTYAKTRTELDLAHAYADSMRLLSDKIGYEEGTALAHKYYGVCDRYRGNHADALKHFEAYIDYYNKSGDELMEAHGWFQIAVVNQELGNYDQSLDAFTHVLRINEKNEQWHGVVATLNGIGIIYKRTEKYAKAIEHYQKAIEVNKSYKLDRDLTYILLNTGNAYVELKEYEKALGYYRQSLDVCYAANNEYGIAANLANSGSVYNLMGQYDKALDFHLRALKIRERLPNKTRLALSLLETGDTYLKLKRFSLAKKYLEEGLALSQGVNAKAITQNAYKYLAELHVASNDYRQAYDFSALYYGMKDSLFSEENVKHINDLQTRYETAEKDKKIAVLAKEKLLQDKETQRQTFLKNTFIMAGLLVALLAGLLSYTFRQRLKNQKALASKTEEIKEAHFKRQLSELEMKALQAQINPHFIFNCMNSINQMIKKGNNRNASKYLTKFSKLIRFVLENAEDTEVSLKDELATLQSYIELEALRFKAAINFEFEVHDEIDLVNTYLPSMVLQPFVENAIWHGIRHKKDASNGKVTILVNQKEDELVCLIEDNGVGRQKALELQKKSILKSKSLGIKITEDRLRLLSKELKKELIRITDLTDHTGTVLGTRVEVNIPIS